MRTARSSSRLLGGGGSASVHAGIHTPWLWAWRPLRPDPLTSPLDVGLEIPLARHLNLPTGCGPGTPPHSQTPQLPPGSEPGDPPPARPLNFPPGSGPGDPPGQTPQPPPWVWAWRPARHAGIPPPRWTEFLTHTSENITLPQLRCGR